MTTYHFRVLRYVHDVSTEEFVNIGVVMWMPEHSTLMFRVNEQSRRLSGFFNNFDSQSYRQMIRNLQSFFNKVTLDLPTLRLFKDNPENTSEIFYELIREDSTCFQWSSLMSGISPTPEKRLDQLFEEFVVVRKSHEPVQRRNKKVIWSTVRKALKAHYIDKLVQYKVIIQATSFDCSFSMGWNNGILQVLEPIPLTHPDPVEIIDKANTWGGRLSILAKDNTFKCTAVISPADEYVNMTAYNQAYAILKNSRAMRTVITEDEVNDYISEIKQDLSIESLDLQPIS